MLSLLSFVPLRAWLVAGGILAAGAAVWTFHHQAYVAGERAAVEAVEKQNTEAQNVADQVRDRVRACFNRGGLWDAGTGECRRRVPGIPSAD